MTEYDTQRLANLMAWDADAYTKPPADIRFLLRIIRSMIPSEPTSADCSPHAQGRAVDIVGAGGAILHLTSPPQ